MMLGKLMGHRVKGATGVVTISGESGINGTYLEETGIRINTDGTIDKQIGAVFTQIDSITDWIIPNEAASSLYEFRIVNVVDTGGDPIDFETKSAAEDVWVAITTALRWTVLASGPGGADSVGRDFDLECRFNGGTLIDSGPYAILSELE